jgi:RNA polymerase sigma-70 factor (ECF subfamily)
VDDHALLEAARAGDQAALEAFIERYQARVLRFGLKMCHDPEEARDVAQDTLLAAARGIARFREASSPSTWLYTIARSFCIKKRRRSRFAPAALVSLEGEAGEAAAGLPTPDTIRRGSSTTGDSQPPSTRPSPPSTESTGRSSSSGDVEGLAATEVAEITGLGVEAVKSRLHRARVQVRERLAPFLGRVPAPARGCPDILGLLSRRLEDELDPESCAEMERHLAACPRCEGACESLKRVLCLCHRSAVPEVPSDLQESVRAGIRAVLGRGN